MRSLIAGLVLATALVATTFLAGPAHAGLPPAISGAWYNPAQSGHGLTVEILPGARAVVFWHVFDPAGDPLHLYIEGNVIGHSIQGRAYAGHGMRFGSFDREEHVLDHWGEVTLRFDSCDRAALAWTADGPAGSDYPDGTMPVRRLSAISGLDCAMPVAGGLPPGRYQGTGDDVNGAFPVEAAVDLGGRLWAVRSEPGFTPRDGVAGQFASLYLGEPAGASSHALDVALVYPSAFMGSGLDLPPRPLVLPFSQANSSFSANGETDDGHGLALAQQGDGDPLRRAFDPAELVGAPFRFTHRTQFFESTDTVQFLADGTLCLSMDEEACRFRGRYLAEDPGLAMVSFELVDQESGFGRFVYSGKAWLLPASAGQPQRLFMAGRGHGSEARTDAGFAVVGHRGD